MSTDFNPKIDPEMRTIEYAGVTVSADMFEHFAARANEGTCFRFVKNENGYITIERLASEGGR